MPSTKTIHEYAEGIPKRTKARAKRAGEGASRECYIIFGLALKEQFDARAYGNQSETEYNVWCGAPRSLKRYMAPILWYNGVVTVMPAMLDKDTARERFGDKVTIRACKVIFECFADAHYKNVMWHPTTGRPVIVDYGLGIESDDAPSTDDLCTLDYDLYGFDTNYCREDNSCECAACQHRTCSCRECSNCHERASRGMASYPRQGTLFEWP
jgi:hypothetical protein